VIPVVDANLMASMKAVGWRYEARSDGFVKKVRGRGAAHRVWLSAAEARKSFDETMARSRAKKAKVS